MTTNTGEIIVIAGPMFCGKSDALCKRCNELQTYGKKKVIAYKPKLDNRKLDERFSDDHIVSRTGKSFPATNIDETLPDEVIDQVLNETEDYEVVAFDEVQLFKKNIMRLVEELAFRGKVVIAAGLNMDYRGKEFGFIGGLMAMADQHIKLHAYCTICGDAKAGFTQRLMNGKPSKKGPIVLIGDKQEYEPRCRKCYIPPHKVV